MKRKKTNKWIHVAVLLMVGIILGAVGEILLDHIISKPFMEAKELRETPIDTSSYISAQGTMKADEVETDEENKDTMVEIPELYVNNTMADIYSYKGYELVARDELHSAAENFEISLQYRKDPEIMFKLADIYYGFQINEGDGCWFMWNFDRAQDLYTESFCLTGDSGPMVSFCKMCDEVILDSIYRDGYKVKILKYYGVEVTFEINEELQQGEYRYYPDFNREGGKLLIEGKDIEEIFLSDF